MISPVELMRTLRMTDPEALAYIRSKVPQLTMTSEEFAILRADVRARAFTMSKVTRLDVLQDVQNALTKAIEDGQTLEQFKNNLKETLTKKGWYNNPDNPNSITASRLALVYRTNVQSAYNVGRYKRQKELAERRPYWRYDSVIDISTSQGCRDINRVTLRHDDPFWLNNYPPRHFRCRGSVTTLNERELERDGIVLTDSESVRSIMPQKGFDGTPEQVYEPKSKDYDKKLFKEYKKFTP